MESGCTGADLLCLLLDWLIRNIDFVLLVLIGIGVVYVAWLDGHTKGHRQGFVDGIMHHIQLRAYDAADFPEKYSGDRFVLEARARLERKLHPKIPPDIRDLP
jgi:hypothetical protein